MLNVLKRGVHVGAVLVNQVLYDADSSIIQPLVDLCGGCTQHCVEGVWFTPNKDICYDNMLLCDFCMFDTTHIKEFEPLLLKLAEKLRELGEQSVMLWVRRDGVLVPHLYEGVQNARSS